MPEAIALSSASVNATRIFGPALAGVVIGIVGTTVAFVSHTLALLVFVGVIASLRAPRAAGPGFAWYDLDPELNASRIDGGDAAVRGILHWLDAQSSSSVGVLGFSQGGAMAVHLLRHAPERFAWAVSLAGFVLEGDAPADARLAAQRPPVFWGRGTADEVTPRWQRMRIRRRSWRSARCPPGRASRKPGRKIARPDSPSARALPVIS